MSLVEQISDGFTRVAEEFNAVRTGPGRVVVSPNIADLPEEGLLIQTGLGNGTGFTLWFDDGTP